jgi:TonB family protein
MRSLLLSLLLLTAAVPGTAQRTPSAASARVYELNEVEVLPRPQNAADFTAALQAGYPSHLRAAGVGGTVQVAFILSPEGQPGDVRVLSTPDSGFNAPTVQAVSMLRFTPAQVQGRAVPVRVEQPITWRVEAAPAAAAAQNPRAPGDSINGYELAEVEELPRPVTSGAFSEALARGYPAHLRAAGVSGTVQVRFRVEPDGSTTHHSITSSTNHDFDEPTLRAIPVLRFRPAKVGGRPVRVWVEQPVQWMTDAALAGAATAAPGDSVNGYELSAVEVLPRVVDRQAFGRALAEGYPPVLRDAGTGGMVHVRFRVEVDGTTSHASITHSTHHDFDAPTLRAVQFLRFRPARIGGKPVRVWVEQPIQWTISGTSGFMPPRYEPDRGRFRPPPNPCSVTQC